MYRPIGYLGRVEETELLLVAEHLDCGLAQDCDVQSRALARRVGEDDLMHQSGLAGARRACDEIEGILRKAAVEHGIEAGHSRWQTFNENFVPHIHVFSLPRNQLTSPANALPRPRPRPTSSVPLQ